MTMPRCPADNQNYILAIPGQDWWHEKQTKKVPVIQLPILPSVPGQKSQELGGYWRRGAGVGAERHAAEAYHQQVH